MRTTDGFKLVLVWLVGCVGALVVGLAPVSSAVVNGHFIPVGPDAFYHAHRILDAVADPASFYQFDPFMHVPEGSLVTWPWAYDWVMSLIVRGALALHLSSEPLAILDTLPVLGFVLAITLVLLLCRQLKLGLSATLLALLATAFFPLNQATYELGNFHHHFAEHLFVLTSLVCGFTWLRRPDSILHACLAGAVLGISVGVHTAQFILQIPLLLALVWTWLRGGSLPRTTYWFALTLVCATLAVALPSLSLREGHFDFYTLSWFQVYFAACTAGLSALLERLPFSRRNALLVCGVAVLMALVIVGPLLFAARFFSNAIAGMTEIAEVQSPWHTAVGPGGPGRVAGLYTYLIYLVPITIGLGIYRLRYETDGALAFFWIASLLGLVLLIQQIRLNYFGSFALFLPWILVVDERARRLPARTGGAILALLAAALVLLYTPGFKRIFERKALANDVYYQITRAIYPALADACDHVPGTVLAEPFDGHYIRYHSRCSVIANPFLVTPLNEAKFLEERRLLDLPAARLQAQAPYVKYVFVRRKNIFYTRADGSTLTMPEGNPNDPDPLLVRELLATPAAQLPPHFRLIKELYFSKDEHTLPYARLFALDGP
jgi:hypothetical protein